ncbi:MAG: hypothetical protein H6573_10895 [Lewinellaceae bacterium]|nr:hypothetical protein [Lewinellaceae bacterium]
MISLFVEKENEQATLALYRILESIDLPEDVGVTINNMRDAKSGILREDGKVVDISLANCYTLEDVVRELVGLVKRQEKT